MSVCIRGVKKERRLVSQTIYFNSKQQTTVHGLPFKVIPLESNALFQPSLPRFYVLLGGFFWDAPQVRRHGPFDDLHAFKTGPLDYPDFNSKQQTTWFPLQSNPPRV